MVADDREVSCQPRLLVKEYFVNRLSTEVLLNRSGWSIQVVFTDERGGESWRVVTKHFDVAKQIRRRKVQVSRSGWGSCIILFGSIDGCCQSDWAGSGGIIWFVLVQQVLLVGT